MKTLASDFSSSNSFSDPVLAGPQAAPSRRTLIVLATLVLLVHALALGTAPSHFGPALAPAATQVTAMLTRSITPPPTPAPLAVAKPPAKAAPAPALKQKSVVAQASLAPPVNLPAAEQPLSPSAVNDPPPDPADTNAPKTPNPPVQATPETAIASATPSASAPATPPTAPRQTPVTAIALPASAEMSYEVTGSAKGLTYYAKSELVWRHNDGSYEARMTVSALFLGSRSMASQGRVGPQGLAPSRFSDRSKAEVAAHFEPEKGQVSFSANTPSVPWLQGGQDRVSVFIQLSGMLAANPAGFPAGANISVYTVGPRDADTWTFRVEGEETLTLPFGKLTALKLSRQLRDDYDQKLEVWYAPSLGYLPVRNKITKINGDFVDQQLNAVGGR